MLHSARAAMVAAALTLATGLPAATAPVSLSTGAVTTRPVTRKPVAGKPVGRKPVLRKAVARKAVTRKAATPNTATTKAASTKAVTSAIARRTATRSRVTRVPAGAPYFLTGYSFWDNTPAGSAIISHPVLHRRAGGLGTYDDPITVAVGHAIINGKDIPLDVPGTRYYLVTQRRYLIVEDTCGDGPRPQDGACYVLPERLRGKATAWLDVWVDGQAAGRAASDRCMSDLTGVTRVVKSPPKGLPVTPGALC